MAFLIGSEIPMDFFWTGRETVRIIGKSLSEDYDSNTIECKGNTIMAKSLCQKLKYLTDLGF